MKKKDNTILIVGAGPAGLACALKLHQNKKSFFLIDKDKYVGGLAKTLRFGKFSTDIGPHRFFSKKNSLYDLIENLIKSDWKKVTRHTRFFVNGRFYFWPIKLGNILTTMEKWRLVRIASDFFWEWGKRFIIHKQPKNFAEFAIQNFGLTLARFNTLHYTEKIWGIPPEKISVDWSSQRIPNLSIFSILFSTLFGFLRPRTMVDEFYYPQNGTGTIYEAILKRIRKTNSVKLSTTIQKITTKNGQIFNVNLSNGQTINQPKFFISSIPVNQMIKLLGKSVPKRVSKAAASLRYRSQVYLFLEINRPNITKDQWIYFPDKDIPFGRISEMKNFSEKMAPKNKTSLFVEFFCWENDEIWNTSKSKLEQLTVTTLEKLGFLKKSEVMNSHLIKATNVYPVYDLNYQKNLKIVMEFLDNIGNLICIGRPGRFRYTNQDHSLEMGLAAADAVITGKKINLDKIGSEKEFQENQKLRK